MAQKNRQYELDWLRVLATLTVFFFHCARYFDREDWHVKNTQTTLGASIFISVLVQWMMPLFFVLSAFSSYHALQRKSGAEYFSERFQRLMIPLIFGIFFLIPPQVYIERATHGQYEGSFVSFLPHYFDGWYGFGGNFAWMGLHLWYLLILFIFSLLTYPVLRFLGQGRGKAWPEMLGRWAGKPGVLYLLGLPLCLTEFFVNHHRQTIGQRVFGGWSLLCYLMVFLLAYLMAADERLIESAARYRYVSLLLVAIVTPTIMYLFFNRIRVSLLMGGLLRGFNSWIWLVAILGFGRQYLRFDVPFLRRANEAALPFYILHQTVIVIIGYLILGWEAPALVEYLVLSGVSLAIILAAYEFLVRRFQPLRFLFGMK